MEQMIMIPKSQYYKMLESYDRATKELEKIRKELINVCTPENHQNKRTLQ